jgi:predicted aspartyl protease
MDDMGILRTMIAVESHTRRGALIELADTMVDTGSEYTWVPRTVLEQLGIGPERIEHFVTADGRVLAREVGFAIVHAAGARTSDDVVFAQEGDMTLLGAHTIEGMNLRVDLKQRRLVPAGPVPAAIGIGDAQNGERSNGGRRLLRRTYVPPASTYAPNPTLGRSAPSLHSRQSPPD